MKLVVGLGNPGSAYAAHRHNVGFRIVEQVGRSHGVKTDHRQFQSLIGEMKFGDERIFLIKPQTFMNLSGEAVGSMCAYYKISYNDLMVVHDDLDLELGRVKFGFGAGAGGHNGVQSIIDHLQTNAFFRLRAGIGRPNVGEDPAKYVLSAFSTEQQVIAGELIQKCCMALEDFLHHGLTYAQQQYH